MNGVQWTPTYGIENISATHVPSWQKEAEKKTRLYVVVYPSDKQSRTFGPETYPSNGTPTSTGSVARAIKGDEIEGLGYGLYLEPAKQSGTKRLFGSGSRVDARLFTFEDVDGHTEVKLRSGTGSGVHGMLIRFLVAEHHSSVKVSEMMQRVHSVMDSTVAQQRDAGVSGIQTVLEQLQRDLIIGRWDVDGFIQTMKMVVEDVKKDGTQLASVTTVNYITSVKK